MRGAWSLLIAPVVLGAAVLGAVEGPPASPTFTENIAPIVYANCVTCHRAG